MCVGSRDELVKIMQHWQIEKEDSDERYKEEL